MRRNFLFLAFFSFLLVGSFFIFLQNALLSDGNIHIYSFKTVEGDAFFIKTPEGHTMLVDGGVSGDILSDVFSQRPLWQREIDVLLLTHPHLDHLSGANFVLRNFAIKTLILTGVQKDDPLYEDFLNYAKQNNITLVFAHKDLDFFLGSVYFDVLFPFDSLVGSVVKNLNNSSIVFRMTYGKRSFLFTGDLEKEGEHSLLSNGTLLKSDFIKVPHQGSRTSSTSAFLDSVNPSWGVVPAAIQNRFSHPHNDVVERYKERNISLFQTGSGTIETFSDGNTICVSQGRRKECIQ
jgi:competence protein ComEC